MKTDYLTVVTRSALFALYFVCSLSFAAQPEVASEAQCLHHLENVPGDWTEQEKWAWNERFCIGQNSVDFSKEICDAEKTNLSPAFIRRMLSYQPMKDVLDFHSTNSISIKCATLNEPLDLANVRTHMRIEFDQIIFRKGIDVAGSSLHDFVIKESQVDGRFHGPGIKTTGLVYFGKSNFNGNINLDGAKIADYLSIADSAIHGAVRLPYANVSEISAGRCSIGKSHHESESGIGFNIVDARIDRSFLLKNCSIKGDMLGISSYIGGRFQVINSTVDGNVQLDNTDIQSIQILPILNDPDSVCKIQNFSVRKATLTDDLILQKCEVDGNIYGFRAHIGGDLNLSGSRVTGSIDMAKSNIEHSVEMSRLETKNIDTSRSIIGKDILIGDSNVANIKSQGVDIGGYLFLNGTTWEDLDLTESTIEKKLWLDGCPKPENKQTVRQISLRGAHVSGIRDTGECVWEDVNSDFSGWEYDSNAMKEILERDVEWLVDWISPEGDSPHVPQPYMYLADRLVELGMTKKANDIRIAEREKNLSQLHGMDGIWQWIVGETTKFGYKSHHALIGLSLLIGVGVVLIKLSDAERPAKYRKEKPYQFCIFAIGVFAALMAIWGFVGIATSGWKLSQWSWDLVGRGTIVVAILMSAVLAAGARRMKLRNSESEPAAEGERTTWRSAVLYSIDRAVPFLGFDSEHVNWFKDKQRLNDMPFLCVYFYVHSILGFALTSLFIAGLTGVLK